MELSWNCWNLGPGSSLCWSSQKSHIREDFDWVWDRDFSACVGLGFSHGGNQLDPSWGAGLCYGACPPSLLSFWARLAKFPHKWPNFHHEFLSPVAQELFFFCQKHRSKLWISMSKVKYEPQAAAEDSQAWGRSWRKEAPPCPWTQQDEFRDTADSFVIEQLELVTSEVFSNLNGFVILWC